MMDPTLYQGKHNEEGFKAVSRLGGVKLYGDN